MKLGCVILAGGRGERLGGVSKADVDLRGRRLLDWLLDDVATLHPHAVVVVAPASVEVPPAVTRTLEDPPEGGPSAGILAGFARLPDVDVVAVLAVDAPFGASELPALLPHLGEGVDGVVAVVDGYRQPLLGVYCAATLRRWRDTHGDARNLAVRKLIGGARLVEIVVRPWAADVDTPEALAGLTDLVEHVESERSPD